jgi:hypothetical protein
LLDALIVFLLDARGVEGARGFQDERDPEAPRGLRTRRPLKPFGLATPAMCTENLNPSVTGDDDRSK